MINKEEDIAYELGSRLVELGVDYVRRVVGIEGVDLQRFETMTLKEDSILREIYEEFGFRDDLSPRNAYSDYLNRDYVLEVS